jgi:glycosyltransferase involved in cell wall biosynthesis
MNILFLTTHLNKGGISRYVLNLAKGLRNRNHNIWVASRGGEWVEELKNLGILHKCIPIKTKSIISPKLIFSLIRLIPFIRQHKIQIIHSNTRVTQCLAYLIYKLLKVPYISAFHGYYQPSLFRKLFKFGGCQTIAVSYAVGKHLSNDLNIGENKINVVYNGIDKDMFRTKNKERDETEFRKEDFLIGILGRISEEKGHFLAIQAIKNLSAKYNNVYLLISGKGKMEEKLKDFVKSLNIQEKVKFLNYKAGDFLDILDLLIMPSKKEGFGYTIIEAFAKKVPVIGFNVGGIPEIIKDKINGVLFYEYTPQSLMKSIEEVMLNHTLRDELRKNADRDINAFSLETMARLTEEVYNKTIC